MTRLLPPAACVAIVLACPARPAGAAPVGFVVNPAASRVTVSGSFEGHSLSPQVPGSDTASFGGTFIGDLADGRLTLNSTFLNSTPFPSPLRPGYPDPGTTQDASYGFTFAAPAGTAYGSIRRLQLYFGNEYGPPMDVADGTFVPRDAGFFVEGGSFDFELPGAASVSVVDLHGFGAPNTAAGPGTLATVGSVQTLTIPLSSTFTTSGDTLTLSLDGQIVATRVVPEPPALALVPALVAPVILTRRRQRCRG